MKKIISITTSCFNESGNIEVFCQKISDIFSKLPDFEYEIIVSDNDSTDGTVEKLRKIAKENKRVKVILNMVNYGHVRSPYNSILHSSGDAVIAMASDLEDPPELIKDFIEMWMSGFKIVAAVRTGSDETGLMKPIRSLFYFVIDKISETKQLSYFTGFGLYDRIVIDQIIKMNDPNPYFRGIVSELGYEISQVFYHKPFRSSGVSKGNFLSNYDLAIQGMVRFSKFPLRFITLFGFAICLGSLLLSIYFFIEKLFNWNDYDAGIIPIILLILFFFGVLFLMLGFFGEYISILITHIVRKPDLIAKEKINFD
jgi:glycosyltransferase involved in cell wall biosynthesis